MNRLKLISTFVLLAALIGAPAWGQFCNLDELDTVTTSGALGPMIVFGSTAYVAAGSTGITWFNVLDPEALEELGSLASQGQVFDMAFDYYGRLLVTAD